MATLLFSKSLTKTDLESCLSIPFCSLGPLPFQEGHSMNMHVEDDSGKEWIFPCSIQRNDNVGKFLSVGWLQFVHQRELRVDDKVAIHEQVLKNQATGTGIKIEVKRKTRLFGEDIWAVVK